MSQSPRFSIVIPAKDEAESLAGVLDEVAAALSGESFEVVVVDDGSVDATSQVLRMLTGERPYLRHLAHDRSSGKSAALLDGDGQNDPRNLPALLALAGEPGVGLAAGQRIKHAHSPAKRLGSQLANRLRSSLLNDHTRDTACGLKAFRRDVFLALPYFDNMHRFLPALILHEGLDVRHLDVIDRPRRHGSSKYGLIDRAAAGAIDLFGVWWMMRRRPRRPQVLEVSDDTDDRSPNA